MEEVRCAVEQTVAGFEERHKNWVLLLFYLEAFSCWFLEDVKFRLAFRALARLVSLISDLLIVLNLLDFAVSDHSEVTTVLVDFAKIKFIKVRYQQLEHRLQLRTIIIRLQTTAPQEKLEGELQNPRIMV